MKIAFYAPLKALSHPTPSGDQAIARDLHDFFLDRGHDVQIISDFRALKSFESAKGGAKAALALVQALTRLKSFRPDIFFSYHSYYRAPDLLGPALSRIFKKPYFIFEAMYSDAPLKSHPVGFYLNRFALQTAQQVFTDKTDDIKGLLKLLPKERVHLVPPSLDLEFFKPIPHTRQVLRELLHLNPDELVISCVAMLRPGRKADGVSFLIRQLAQLKSQGQKFRFLLMGDGEAREKISEELKVLGSSAQALGSLPRSEVRDWLSACDVFAFPGIDEGFGLVYLEAQAMGLPVVAFNNGGIPDAVRNGEGGYLTPFMDELAYQMALKRLLTDSKERERMSKAARAYVSSSHDRVKNYAFLLAKMGLQNSP